MDPSGPVYLRTSGRGTPGTSGEQGPSGWACPRRFGAAHTCALRDSGAEDVLTTSASAGLAGCALVCGPARLVPPLASTRSSKRYSTSVRPGSVIPPATMGCPPDELANTEASLRDQTVAALSRLIPAPAWPRICNPLASLRIIKWTVFHGFCLGTTGRPSHLLVCSALDGLQRHATAHLCFANKPPRALRPNAPDRLRCTALAWTLSLPCYQ